MRALAAAPGLWRLATPALLAMTAPAARTVVTSRRTRRVISEECLLGAMTECLLSPRGIYPDAARRLRALKRMIGRREAKLVLTVRAYDDWFVSLYSWSLLHRKLPPAPALARAWAGRARGWPDLVREIEAVFGSCEIIEFGSLKRDPGAIVRALIGEAIDIRHAGASLSAAGLAEVEARRRQGERVGIGDLGEIRSRRRNEAPLDPFDEETRARLRERYARDLALIGVTAPAYSGRATST